MNETMRRVLASSLTLILDSKYGNIHLQINDRNINIMYKHEFISFYLLFHSLDANHFTNVVGPINRISYDFLDIKNFFKISESWITSLRERLEKDY